MSVVKFFSPALAAVGMALLAGPAPAADIYGGYGGPPPSPPPYFLPPIWQGFYIGGNVGGAWASVGAADNVVFLGGSSGTVIANRSLSASGVLGGIQTGYNFQSANMVYGVEFDFGGMGNSATGSFQDTANPSRILRVTSSGGWYGDITGRIGYAYNNALFYFKGGYAFFTSDVQLSDSFDNFFQNSGTFSGFTVGTGVEVLINPSWSFKVEYMYYDFGDSSGSFDNSLSVNTVKVGFNYIFNYGFRPLY